MFKEEVKKYPKKCKYCGDKLLQYNAHKYGYICKKCNTNYIIVKNYDNI